MGSFLRIRETLEVKSIQFLATIWSIVGLPRKSKQERTQAILVKLCRAFVHEIAMLVPVDLERHPASKVL